MQLDPKTLARFQLAAMLGLVVTVVLLLASYFFYQQWRDFHDDSAAGQQQARQRGQLFLRAWGEHAAQSLSSLHRQSHDVLRTRLREQVDAAHALATALYQRQHGRVADAHIRRDIVAALRPQRYFDGRGYFFIDTLDGDCVLLPTAPEREGHSLLDNRDDRGRYIMRQLLQAVDNPQGAGYSSYRWYRPGERSMSEKVAYARRFAPYGWLIGGGEYLRNVQEDMQRQGLALLRGMRIAGYDGLLVLDENGRPQPPTAGADDIRHNTALQRLWLAAKPGSVLAFAHGQGEQRVPYSAYVTTVPEWGWRVIAIAPDRLLLGNSLQDGHARLLAQTRERLAATLGIFVAALLLALLCALLFSRWMQRLVADYRGQLQAQARELELTRHMSDSAADCIVLLGEQQQVVYQNQQAQSLLHGDDRARLLRLLADTPCDRLTLEQVRGERTLEIQLSTLHYQGERYRCATARDISERIAQQRQLLLAAKVFEASNEAILITDADSRIVAVNRAFSTITGYSEEEVLGHSPSLLASGRHDAAFYAEMWRQLRERGQWAGEIWNRRKSGEIYPEWLTISALRDQQGALQHYVALFADISERKAAEAKVQHLAEHDLLTDLPNRLLLMDRLQQALGAAERSGHKVAVLFMDLDRFKNINDTLGHAAGDALLQQVARRCSSAVRDMDTVGRSGGDEFVLILPQLGDSTQAALIAERILAELQVPLTLAGQQLVISASIGIAISPDDGNDPSQLLKNADMAMYEAKAHGRNGFRFFNERMTVEVSERLQLESRLRGALARQELHLVLQPKVRTHDRRLTGFEALLRWTDRDGCVTPPARFIPVAEESGLIVDIGQWVLREACGIAAAWPRDHGQALTIAVNVSARQLAQPGFADEVGHILQHSGLPPAQLEIEVTESVLLERTHSLGQTFDGLKRLGVRLAVDDFGTGYSSLAYLKDFAPDTVKIDRCFVTALDQHQDNAAIVLAVITLARSLGMEALAEGVETEDELGALARLGCDTVQGYLTGRPLSLPAAAALVAEHGATALRA